MPEYMYTVYDVQACTDMWFINIECSPLTLSDSPNTLPKVLE